MKLLKPVLVVLGAVLAGFICYLGWIFATDPLFSPVTTFDASLWKETENGYIAESERRGTGLVCVCGGYECPKAFDEFGPTKVETTYLAYEGYWRPRYQVVKDPLAGNDPNWRRRVQASPNCVSKTPDTTITLRLSRSADTEWLMLSIE